MQKIMSILLALLWTTMLLHGLGMPVQAQTDEQIAVQQSRDVPTLARILDEVDRDDLRPAAIEALSKVGTPAAAEVLAEHIGPGPIRKASMGPLVFPGDVPNSLSYPAVRALMKIGPSGIPPVLHELLTGPDRWAEPCLIFLVEEMPKVEVKTALDHLLPSAASAAARGRVNWALANLPRYTPAGTTDPGAQFIKRCSEFQGAVIPNSGVVMLPASKVASVLGLSIAYAHGSDRGHKVFVSKGPNPKTLKLLQSVRVSVGPGAAPLVAVPYVDRQNNEVYVPFESVADYFGWKGKSYSELQAEWEK